MTDLEKIESSVERQMACSELLMKKLAPKKCWHKAHKNNRNLCSLCNETSIIGIYAIEDINPNLFIETAFLTVFGAVKDREDIRQHFGIMARQQADFWIPADDIGSPDFPLAVLGLLLEQDNEGERLTSILEGEGE